MEGPSLVHLGWTAWCICYTLEAASGRPLAAPPAAPPLAPTPSPATGARLVDRLLYPPSPSGLTAGGEGMTSCGSPRGQHGRRTWCSAPGPRTLLGSGSREPRSSEGGCPEGRLRAVSSGETTPSSPPRDRVRCAWWGIGPTRVWCPGVGQGLQNAGKPRSPRTPTLVALLSEAPCNGGAFRKGPGGGEIDTPVWEKRRGYGVTRSRALQPEDVSGAAHPDTEGSGSRFRD